MVQTGAEIIFDGNATASHRAAPGHGRLRQRLLYRLSALAFVVSVAMPVTIDATTNAPGFKTALAGNENGTGDGQGNGQGNGKGRGDEIGGGKKRLNDDDDDDDDDDVDNVGNDDDIGQSASDEPGSGTDAADDVDEVAYGESVEALDGVPAGTPAATLPTIQQVFSLGEDSALSAEQELLAIQNGWGAPPN